MNWELFTTIYIFFSTALAHKRLATEVEIDVKLMFIEVEIDVKLMFIRIIESLSLCAVSTCIL